VLQLIGGNVGEQNWLLCLSLSLVRWLVKVNDNLREIIIGRKKSCLSYIKNSLCLHYQSLAKKYGIA
jgi:hypothetical protein